MIYLDTIASYPVLSEVKEALNIALESSYANSAAKHLLAEETSKDIENVRSSLAEMIGAYASEIVFTSGATESNNMAFKSILFGKIIPEEKRHIITTQIEHKCILSICKFLSTHDYEITYLKPNSDGIVDYKMVEEAIKPNTALVSVMHVNNELGSINPLSEIGALCRDKGVLFHSDAAQSFRKLPINVDDYDIDIMSVSAHKIGGPKGIGALYIRNLRKLQLEPVIHGAGQEEGLRGGTVAGPLIIGFGAAAEYFPVYFERFKLIAAKDYLLNELAKEGVSYIINGGKMALENCVSLTLPNTDVGRLIRENEKTLCLAQGSACSSKEIEASHVLVALGLSRSLADKTLRISFPLDIKLAEIDLLMKAIKQVTNSNY